MAILMVSGSPRPQGLTIHAVRALAHHLETAGLSTEILDLAQEDFPVYRGEPVAPIGLEWRDRVRASHALILASPEYHGGMSSAIKTFLDHLTFDEIRDRPIGLVGVASGLHAGTRAALQVQDVVTVLWGRVVGPALVVPNVKEAFDDSGDFRDPQLQRLVPIFVARLQQALSGE
jgi:FMN reductase